MARWNALDRSLTMDGEDDRLFEEDDFDASPAYEALRGSLSDEHQDASSADLADALDNILDELSPAEAFNFAQAMGSMGRSVTTALADPTVSGIVRAALPVVGGAVGTVVGGPIGTAIGSSLGTAAARALPAAAGASSTHPTGLAAKAQVPPGPTGPMMPGTLAPTTQPPAPAQWPAQLSGPAVGSSVPVAPGSVTALQGGSASAAQGLVLTQQPDVLKALLALALGQHGARTVNGIPVASIAGMLGSVFSQAAADAEELRYLDDIESSARFDDTEGAGTDETPGLDAWPDRRLYRTLVDADNAELTELWGIQ